MLLEDFVVDVLEPECHYSKTEEEGERKRGNRYLRWTNCFIIPQLRWLTSAIDDLKDTLDSKKERRQICLVKISDRWSTSAKQWKILTIFSTNDKHSVQRYWNPDAERANGSSNRGTSDPLNQNKFLNDFRTSLELRYMPTRRQHDPELQLSLITPHWKRCSTNSRSFFDEQMTKPRCPPAYDELENKK
ncbi:chloroplastic/amyloplastic,Glucose-1-phosphate adenylyltransferase large subunit [Trichinella spiralis]|uniref:Chloroplastic/amyloplastic,Glucose-1-phosphate adenylyltransferase large subunit n=1 Tax=Trichinella spiralis TaxID=6334 RepID=A0ABR3KMB8_TRISP